MRSLARSQLSEAHRSRRKPPFPTNFRLAARWVGVGQVSESENQTVHHAS